MLTENYCQEGKHYPAHTEEEAEGDHCFSVWIQIMEQSGILQGNGLSAQDIEVSNQEEAAQE